MKKRSQKVFSVIMALTMAFALSVSAFATGQIAEEDNSNSVTRVYLPNPDGTYSVLEGEEAQAWYNEALAETEERIEQESAMLSATNSMGDSIGEPMRGPFHYKYRYIESKHTTNVRRTDLERAVTNELENNTSRDQSYKMTISVSQSWTVSPSLSSQYKNAITATLGASWGETYETNEEISVTIPSHKTCWMTFIPIMDKSEGQAQKYFIPRGPFSDTPFVEESYDVVTYAPKYLNIQVGSKTTQGVFGAYIWHEK